MNIKGSKCLSLIIYLTRASSLKITNRSFRYAAPCLWNELSTDLREPRQTQSPAVHLSHMAVHHLHRFHYHRLHHLLLAQYFILNSRLGSSANPFLQKYLFPYRTDSTDSRTITLLNGWICLHGVLD